MPASPDDIAFDCKTLCPVLWLKEVHVDKTDSGSWKVTIDKEHEITSDSYKEIFNHVLNKYRIGGQENFYAWFKKLYGDCYSAYVDASHGTLRVGIFDRGPWKNELHTTIYSPFLSYDDVAIQIVDKLGSPF